MVNEKNSPLVVAVLGGDKLALTVMLQILKMFLTICQILDLYPNMDELETELGQTE